MENGAQAWEICRNSKMKTASTPNEPANSCAPKWLALRPLCSIPCTQKVKTLKKTDKSGSRITPDCRCARNRILTLAEPQGRNTARLDSCTETFSRRCEHHHQRSHNQTDRHFVYCRAAGVVE